MTPTGLLLCDDLLLASKVTATARAHGLAVTVCRDAGQLAARLAEASPRVILLDLHNSTLDLSAVAGWREAGVRVIGFGSHVAKDVLHAAREAGCDPVLPRSKFFAGLEEALPVWLAATE